MLINNFLVQKVFLHQFSDVPQSGGLYCHDVGAE